MASLAGTLADPSPLSRMAAALLSATCMVLACPTYDMWWLGFVGWIPWFWAIDGVRPRHAFFYGWITGTVTVFWGFFWMSELLTKFAGFPLVGALPITLIFALWHGALWGIAAGVASWVTRRSGRSWLYVAPLSWMATEALLPNIFPIYMGLAWCWQPLWIQTAEIGGVTMVAGFMLAINAAGYRTLRSLLDGQLEMRAAVALAALLAFLPAYGAIRIAQVKAQMSASPTLNFAVIQGNFSIFEMRNMRLKHPILRGQQQMTKMLQDQGAQVALWGETAYPNPRAFVRTSTHDLEDGNPWKVQQDFDIPIIFGTVTRDATGANKYLYNTALLLDGEGNVAGMYDKVYRLVFGEYVPLVDPDWYLARVPNASHIAQGAGASVLTLDEWRLGPFICYEDILPRYVRETANQRVHVFVNLTNDSWFGKTAEPWQHLGLAVFRTVEHRKGMVRSVNTGVSAYIDPTGEAVNTIPATEPDIDGPQPAAGLLAKVPMMDPDQQTLYGLTGEGINMLAILGLVAFGWRRREGDEGPAVPPKDGGASDDVPAEDGGEDDVDDDEPADDTTNAATDPDATEPTSVH
jgi:apolipoprotein N-acyltransferase